MAEIKGTNVGAPIVPFTTDDIYATHEAKYGKGGYRSVQTLEELNNIPEARLEEGMMVYVIDDPSGIHTYQWIGGKWVRDRIGKGIPIYNQELIDDLGIDTETETYISIPDKDTDLGGKVEEKNYKTTINGNYVDVLFSAIRELQSEVARLKNSFRYGIESYTGTKTAMSDTIAEIESPEEEPLWAVEEDGLSEIYELPLEKSDCLEGGELKSINDPVTYNAYLEVEGTAQWTAPKEILDVEDPKMFMYLTTKGTNNKIELLGYEKTKLDGGESNKLELDLKLPDTAPQSLSGFYNTLLIIGRKQIVNSVPQNNSNFIWLSISNPETNQAIVEGYWKDGLIVNYGDPGINSINDVEIPWRYQFNRAWFTDTTITKFKVYSKYQDFTKDIMGSIPSDETYKFKVAHITIRSVKDTATLTALKDQILNNELVWDEGSGRLWIKTNNKLAVIGGGSGSVNTDSNMTQEELINALKEMGIVYEEGGSLNINDLNVEGITFIHTATGKRFKFYINGAGELCNEEIPDESKLLANRAKAVQYNPTKDVRGYIGCLGSKESGIKRTSDLRLSADRLKIGAFYAPFSEDLVHGCTHSFVELENTSDKDIALEGCYLHLTRPNDRGSQVVYSLPLTGVIKAGGTYLVRGARHAENDDPNVYIKVNTCDQEWYNDGSLVSLEVDESLSYTDENRGYGLCLTYGNDFDGGPLKYNTRLVENSTDNADTTVGSMGDTFTVGSSTATYPYIIYPNFIDGIYYKSMVGNKVGYWASKNPVELTSNSMYKNMFELDPAKQAFQGFTTKDSSRVRWANNNNDVQVVDLNNEYIYFPHTEDKYPVSNYTPKASWEGKNVSTDKTKLDPTKPNMVTCSFGVNIYKTRTFNWISVGYFDEYVWIKKEKDSNWIGRYESYVPKVQIKASSVEAGDSTTKINFTIDTTGWSGSLGKYTKITDASGILIENGVSATLTGGVYSVTVNKKLSGVAEGTIFYLLQSNDEAAGTAYPRRKFFNADINNNIYARITGRFPGDNSYYTSHKVILDVVENTVTTPTKYVYVVGRADKNGNPDPAHCSQEMSFTLYPSDYTMRIYQTSDQQGFHWIEYQVWAAAAKKLEEKINSDVARDKIVPVLVNTGDMTQNGTRINEWFDYYQAGRNLFKHLEQVNVVGNNDLCGTNPNELGTGDDSGKSNSFYFHLFYCYEVGNLFTPLVKPSAGGAPKYIPSLYYIESTTDRLLMVNSEITETNCKEWYGLMGNYPINIYTGYEINSSSAKPTYHGEFESIYSMIYNVLSNAGGKSIMVGCHEMPFTVITNDSLLTNYKGISRSLSNANALVGSHLNQISPNEGLVGENNKPGTYWFSRLLEYFKVKLCIGGHKHTYCCTYPVRENYTYTDSAGSTKSSKENGPMKMEKTLENDSVNFIQKDGSGVLTDLTKFPLVKSTRPTADPGVKFYPSEFVPDLTGGVTYFMCQATGYKLTSNKELPSADQTFTMVLPETKTSYSGTSYTDTPSNDQKRPMFAIIDVKSGSYSIKLARVENIFNGNFRFTQTLYSSDAPKLTYLTQTSDNRFGKWGETELELVKL